MFNSGVYKIFVEIELSTRKVDALKLNLRTKLFRREAEVVVVEGPINLYLNGEHLTTIIASPVKVKELAVGFLVDEGIITTIEEIQDILVDDLCVKVQTAKNVKLGPKVYGIARFVNAACDSLDSFLKLLDNLAAPKVTSALKVHPRMILQALRELNRRCLTFKATGGVHAAAVFTADGRCISFAEDVGRHTAVDKAIGGALLVRVNLQGCLLVSTGRLSGDIVLKAARTDIPIVASVACPLYSGVYAAEKTHITLIGFVRGQRMNVYTCMERIIWPYVS
ncbi:MAG: formate dehydrogenase accessory sulfurtransferase FdhD [Candidatus Bathyarchaeia archaeon]